MEAWFKSEGGEIQADLVLYEEGKRNERGRHALHSRKEDASHPSSHGTHWQYGACDIPLEKESGLLEYNIEVTVRQGTGWIDGLQVLGSDSLVTNGGFKDQEVSDLPGLSVSDVPRGWRRSFLGATPSGEAEGTFGIEGGSRSKGLVVRKSEGQFVLSAEPILLPQGVTRFVARLFVDVPEVPPPILVVCQTGRKGALKEDRSSQAFSLEGETVYSTGPLEIDPAADRLVCLLRFPAQEGEWKVRSVDLLPLSSPNPDPKILLDQVGYDSEEPFRFLVASPVFPASGTCGFSLANDEGKQVTGFLEPLGRTIGQGEADWGNYYFEGLVEDPPQGDLFLEVSLGGHTVAVSQVIIGPQQHLKETGELAYEFFHWQRCGTDLPGWHGACHLDDARLPDGTHVDLTGGYHNAGDFHKHMGDNTPVAVFGMVTAYERCKEFFDRVDADGNERADLLDEVFWGADWLLKMVDPKTGGFWMNVTNDIEYFGIPEKDTDGIIGTGDDRVIGATDPSDLGGLALAAWAVLSRNQTNTKYLQAAERVWAVYESRILASREPRLLIAALELYRTTHNEKYRLGAERLTRNLLDLQSPDGCFATSPGGGAVFRIVDEGTIPAALASYALAWPAAPLAGETREALRKYYTLVFRMADNPFGIFRHYSDLEPFYFKKRADWFGGSNSAYCSLAWSALLAADVFAQEPDLHRRLKQIASDQMHWILGLNPLDLCMFEGKGNSERIRYHHLSSEFPGHSRGAVPGAIPNGIVREPGNTDRPWFDLRSGEGSLPGAESAEPWLPHNAYYLLTLSVAAAAKQESLSPEQP
jgi:hypothetical protein